MPKKSAAAQARHDEAKQALETELKGLQELSRLLRTSSESTLAKSHKLKDYHAKIMELQGRLERHGP